MNLRAILDGVDLDECIRVMTELAKELKERNDPRARALARASGVLKLLNSTAEVAAMVWGK